MPPYHQLGVAVLWRGKGDLWPEIMKQSRPVWVTAIRTSVHFHIRHLADIGRNRGKFPGEWGSQGFENIIQAGDDNWHP